ncbi:MAG TPA: hypothetical protein PLU30_24295 [Verrucomicrobiae bacterium]|nr:hypothetical protein [Verrucomicrobiae bacterium]
MKPMLCLLCAVSLVWGISSHSEATPPMHDSKNDFTITTLRPYDGELITLLRDQYKKAKALSQKPFVEFYAEWSEPSRALRSSFNDPATKDAFAGTYIIQFNSDLWKTAAELAGFSVLLLPVFFEISEDGKPTGRSISGAAWANKPQNMAPLLKHFFSGERALSSEASEEDTRRRISFSTIDGRKFTDVKVTRVTSDAVIIMTENGIEKVPLDKLSPAVRKEFALASQVAKTITEPLSEVEREFRAQKEKLNATYADARRKLMEKQIGDCESYAKTVSSETKMGGNVAIIVDPSAYSAGFVDRVLRESPTARFIKRVHEKEIANLRNEFIEACNRLDKECIAAKREMLTARPDGAREAAGKQ